MTMIQLTIEEVEQQFQQWRSNKQPREKIPNYLWDMVEQLLKFYPPGRIIKRLHLSVKQMRRKGLMPLPNGLATENMPFVNLNLPSLPNNFSQLVIKRVDGTQLLCSNLSDNQLLLSVRAFLNQDCEEK